jgi:hypothetical protein
MSRRSKARRGAGPSRSGAAPEIAAPRPDERILAAPAAWIAVAVAAACVLLSVTTRIDDPDVWQHLLVGKAIARLGQVPLTHLWTWPRYGLPDVLPSWGFRALLWPFWSIGGVTGLFVWRWLTTLLTFGILLWTARRAGARGLSPLLVLVVCALTYRLRSQARPETLVAVLLALQLLLIVPRRRALGVRTGVALVAIAWAWANVHLSYYLGLALIGIAGIDAAVAVRGTASRARAIRPWAITLAAAIAISFVNPFGWRALAQPFEYFLFWRHEPIMKTIIELAPLDWGSHWKSGLPLLVITWPLLLAWRARHDRWDVLGISSCALFTTLALTAQRFAGLYAVAAAPFVARDLDAWIARRRWPAWSARAVPRAVLVASACVAAGVLEWSRPDHPIGVGIDWRPEPVRACDFMATEGIRGRGFNPYYFGGYQLWRFWPDRSRLPFMDIHQSGSVRDRALYAYAFANPEAWLELDQERRFDYCLIDGHPEAVRGDRLLDVLDADTTWSLVFRDDAAALYVRRSGALSNVAERLGYRVVPGGEERLPAVFRVASADSAVRERLRLEVHRQIAESPYNARAHALLAGVALGEGDRAGARAELELALDSDPEAVDAHRRLGVIALRDGRPRDAIREFEAELRLGYGPTDLEFMIGQAWSQLGDPRRAADAYRRELRNNPAHAAARESLAVIGR